MVKKKLLVYVLVYDHFSSEEPGEMKCVSEFSGLLVSETERYLKLRHIKADIGNRYSAEEHHNVLKCAIKTRKDFELDFHQVVRDPELLESMFGADPESDET